MKELYANETLRSMKSKTAARTWWKTISSNSEPSVLIALYKEFVSIKPQFTLPEGVNSATWQNTCEYTQGFLENKRIESLDIPALIILQKALLGHKASLDIHHTVLDEAQDFSPFMFDILKSLTVNEAFTIVGDLAQGIYSYRGVTDWGDMKKNVFEHGSQFYELITSYRNT